MGQINAGQTFGNAVVDPTRFADVQIPRSAFGPATGWMRNRGAEMVSEAERELKTEGDALQRARALRIGSEAGTDLAMRRAELVDQIRAGKVSRDQVASEWAARVKESRGLLVTDAGLSTATTELLGAKFDAAARGAEVELLAEVRGYEADATKAELITSLENLARAPMSDRAGVVQQAVTAIETLGPAARLGPDDQVKLRAGFVAQLAANDAKALILSARDNPAALDAVEKRLQSAEFSDLSPQARIFAEQQIATRRSFLEHKALADQNRADAEAARAELATFGQAELQVVTTGKVDPVLWQALKPAHQASLIRAQRAEARARRAEAAAGARQERVTTDWPLYLQLRDQAAAEPDKFVQRSLGEFVDRIGPRELEQLADIRAGIVKETIKGQLKAPPAVASLSSQINATASALKMKPTERGKFTSYVQSEVDAATAAKGKALTFAERRAIIDTAVLEGPDPEAWLWGTKRAYQLSPEARARFKPTPMADAPASELDALNEALRTQGLPQTPANRLALYRRTVGATK